MRTQQYKDACAKHQDYVDQGDAFKTMAIGLGVGAGVAAVATVVLYFTTAPKDRLDRDGRIVRAGRCGAALGDAGFWRARRVRTILSVLSAAREPRAERAPRYAGGARRGAHVAAMFAKQLVRSLGRRARLGGSQATVFGQRDVTRIDLGARRRHRRAVEHGRKLSHVAGPRSTREGARARRP